MKTFRTMLQTELKLSLRGMDMLIFAIFLPLAALVILGVIYGEKPAFAGAEYSFLEQSFSALATISICAGGVMGLPLVLSDYRSKKILKRYRVTPVHPALLVLVQLAIYALYAVASLLLLFLVARVFFGYRFHGSLLEFFGGYLLVIVSMFSIGVLVGGLAPNTKIAGVIASILYFPMLIFSGATLPYEVMPKALQWLADVLPLTQGIKLLKAASLGLESGVALAPSLVMLAIALLCAGASLKFFKWE